MRACKGQLKRRTRATWMYGLVLILLLAAIAPARTEETAGILFQAGLYEEQVRGELDAALKLYQRILDGFPTDRAVAAKALLHIGLCREKLGRQEALEAYQKLVEQYPEQRQQVAAAKERIAELSKTMKRAAQQPTFRKIEIASKPQNGVLSPDGTRLAFVSDGALWTVPLHGKVDPDIAGEPVRMAEVPGIWDAWNLLAWSADGKWIAVNAWPDKEDTVVVVPVAGGEPRVVQLPKRGGHAWSHRLAISPDGQMIAISALKLGTRPQEVLGGIERYIYTIPTTGGEPKQVSSGWARLPSFSPDGKFIAYVGYHKRADWPEDPRGSLYDGDLWLAPSDGGAPIQLANVDGRLRGPVWSPDGRFIAALHEPGATNDSKEMWVYPLSLDRSSTGEPIKISLPRSSWDMPAGWTPGGELGVFMATKEHWAMYTVPASGGKAVQITPASVIPIYPRWSPDGKRIYFRGEGMSYVPATGGDPVQVPVRSERRLVSIVPGGGFNISPDGKKIVISAYQEPRNPREGVDVWTMPVDGRPATRLTNNVSRETYPCWSPDGKWVAFVEEKGFNAIYVIPSEGGEIRQISSESDKVGGGAIAFSPDGERIAFFSEGSIKTIPVEGGQAKVLASKVKSNRQSQLAYSPDGSKIAHDAVGKIWITQLDGGESEELQTGLPKDAKLNDIGWSPDGEKIAFVGIIGGEPEFWLISNFLPETPVAETEPTTVRRIGGDWGTFASLSPDGKYLCDVDWKTETLAVLELATGKVRHVTSKSSADACYPLDSAISPDSREVAYLWWDPDTRASSLHVVGLDGAGHRVLREGGYPMPRAWSADGRKILAVVGENDIQKVVWVSASDGSLQEIASFPGESLGYPGKFDISPNGRFIAYDRPQTEHTSHRDIFVFDMIDNSEFHVIEHPSNDKLLGWTPDGRYLLFASYRSGTWDAWLQMVTDGQPQGFPKLVKPDIGDIRPIGFALNGSYYYAHERELQDLFTARFDLETGAVLSEPVPVRQTGATTRCDWSPDGQYLAYCERRPDKSHVIYIRTLSTGRERMLADNLPDIRWLRWSLEGRSVLIDGARRADSQGVVFGIDAQTGERSELVRSETEVLLRPEMSPDGRTLFFDRVDPKSGTMRLTARDLETGREKELFQTESPAQISGADLSPDGRRFVLSVLPSRTRSQGPVLKILSTAGGQARELIHFDASERLRAVGVTWMPDSQNVIFWKWFQGDRELELWRVSAEGGTPEKLWIPKDRGIGPGHMRIHPDGQRVAFQGRSTTRGVWVLENFLPATVAGD